MSIKAILFDLDGVLIDADKWHFNALNTALQFTDVEPISWQEHITIYKGIPTKKKLGLLTERKGLKVEDYDRVNILKQEVTNDIIERFCTPDLEKIEMMRLLKNAGYTIGVCSNAIRNSVKSMLTKSGLIEYVSLILSNQDVTNAKPSPEIYLKAFSSLNLLPSECIIVEDSDVGKTAARASKGILCSVSGPEEVNYYTVLNTLLDQDKVNVVIPAAGQGKRFSEVGYSHPKPLIDVKGRPMISYVLDNFENIGHKILLIQKKHIDRYRLNSLIPKLDDDTVLVPVDGLTEGAACTVMLAESHINNDSELIIANSDQYISKEMFPFVNHMRSLNADGGILTFRDTDPKWSYAKCDETGKVSEVAEKKVISEFATVGIYYFKKGSDFIKYTNQMIEKNIRVNNEFYVCPVYNEFILDNKIIYKYDISKEDMHGLGTPEDLIKFLKII